MPTKHGSLTAAPATVIPVESSQSDGDRREVERDAASQHVVDAVGRRGGGGRRADEEADLNHWAPSVMPEMVPAAARARVEREDEEECQPLHLAPPFDFSASDFDSRRFPGGGGQLLGFGLRLDGGLKIDVLRVDGVPVLVGELDDVALGVRSLPPAQMPPRLMMNEGMVVSP